MMQLTVIQLQSKPRKSITGSVSCAGVDLNKSRRTAHDAMDKMRKNRVKRGRVILSRTGTDLNKSRRAAQDAMDKMRKNRVKRGRVILSGGIVVSNDNHRD